jgi:DivIVA domain-containing protein
VPETGLLARGDVDKVRFSVGARGYRMDEVDDVLDRLAYEIDVRERRIAGTRGARARRGPRRRGAPAGIEAPDAPDPPRERAEPAAAVTAG